MSARERLKEKKVGKRKGANKVREIRGASEKDEARRGREAPGKWDTFLDDGEYKTLVTEGRETKSCQPSGA